MNSTPDTPSKISASGSKVHLGRLTDFSFRINSTPDNVQLQNQQHNLLCQAWFQLHDQRYSSCAEPDFSFTISSSTPDMPSMISTSGSAVSVICPAWFHLQGHVMHSAWFQISRTSIRLAWFQLNQMINMCRWSTVHLILPACVIRISGTYHTPSVTCMTMTVHETPSTNLAWGPTVTHADNYTQHGFSLQNQWQQAFDEEGGKWYTVWFLLLGQQ